MLNKKNARSRSLTTASTPPLLLLAEVPAEKVYGNQRADEAASKAPMAARDNLHSE
jgi:hypothetical protein